MCDAEYRSNRPRAFRRPRWGLLWGLVLLETGMAGAVEFATAPGALRIVLRTGLVLAGFGAIALWVRRNGAALDLQDWCGCAAEKMTVGVISSRRPGPDGAVRPSVADVPPIEEDEAALTASTGER